MMMVMMVVVVVMMKMVMMQEKWMEPLVAGEKYIFFARSSTGF